MSKKRNAIRKLIEEAGGAAAVAELIGASPFSVNRWMVNNKLPTSPGIVEKTIREEAARRAQLTRAA